MTLPSLRDWIFSIKTFAAAMLALYLGFAMSVPRPYWAMATVYICSHPLSGATRSKSAYRVLGTLIGAAAAVAMVPNLVDAPELLVLALALWTALCLYLSLLDRTPRSYVFMLGGYTAALIGFPAVNDPGSIFDLAVARTEAITLGIVCASVVSGLVLPRAVGPVVARRIDEWFGRGARFSLDALAGTDPALAERELVGLAGEAAEIGLLSSHLAYDASALRDNGVTLNALRLRAWMLLPVLSSIADRLSELRGPAEAGASGTGLPGGLTEIVARLRSWISPRIRAAGPADLQRELADADELRDLIAAADPKLDAASTWTDMLVASLLIRLRDFIDLASDCRALRRAIASGRPVTLPLHVKPEAGAAPVRYKDHLLPLLSALGVAIAIMLTSGLWIATGWPDGSSAPMMAAVACSFFSAKDDPAPAIVEFAVWSAVAIGIIGFYLFAVLPHVNDFEILVLVMAPAYLVFGLMISMPKTMGKGLALAANGSTLMALQGSYNADFTSFANGAVAFLIGMGLSAALTQVLRSVGADFSVRRLMRAGAATLAAAAHNRGRGNRGLVAGLMLDQLSLLAPRLAALPAGPDRRARLAVAAPRIGLNIVDLRRARHHLAPRARQALDVLLDALAEHYRRSPDRPDAALLSRIDAALCAVATQDSEAGRRDAVLGLVGLRRGIFPEAPPYRPETMGPETERLAA